MAGDDVPFVGDLPAAVPDLLRRHVLLEGLDPARDDARRRARRLVGQHHPDCDGLLGERDEAEPLEALDEVGRRRGICHLPRRGRPAALANERPNLLDGRLDLVGVHPETLRHRPGRVLAPAEPQDEALRHDELLARPERDVGVRVLREHADQAPTRCAATA